MGHFHFSKRSLAIRWIPWYQMCQFLADCIDDINGCMSDPSARRAFKRELLAKLFEHADSVVHFPTLVPSIRTGGESVAGHLALKTTCQRDCEGHRGRFRNWSRGHSRPVVLPAREWICQIHAHSHATLGRQAQLVDGVIRRQVG